MSDLRRRLKRVSRAGRGFQLFPLPRSDKKRGLEKIRYAGLRPATNRDKERGGRGVRPGHETVATPHPARPLLPAPTQISGYTLENIVWAIIQLLVQFKEFE